MHRIGQVFKLLMDDREGWGNPLDSSYNSSAWVHVCKGKNTLIGYNNYINSENSGQAITTGRVWVAIQKTYSIQMYKQYRYCKNTRYSDLDVTGAYMGELYICADSYKQLGINYIQ